MVPAYHHLPFPDADFVYSPLVANIDTETNSAPAVASFLVPGNLSSQVTNGF